MNPPEFVISIILDNEEYMVGVTCSRHKDIVSSKVGVLQNEGKIPQGKIHFSELKPVGTNCIKGHPDDLIQIS